MVGVYSMSITPFDGSGAIDEGLFRSHLRFQADAADLEQKVAAIRQKVNLVRPADIAPDLAAALKQLQRIRSRSKNEQVQFLLQNKEMDFQEALRLAAGLLVDVVASDESVVPGQEFDLTTSSPTW